MNLTRNSVPNGVRPKLAQLLEQLKNVKQAEVTAAKENQQTSAADKIRSAENMRQNLAASAPMGETLSDDVTLADDRKQQIQRDEAVARSALALFGVDYDALIRLDDSPEGTPSVYQRAIIANPGLQQAIFAAPSPVVAALEIAAQFAPFAQFQETYGDTPEAIKAKLREELKAELLAAGEGTTSPNASATDVPAFSTSARGAAPKQMSTAKRKTLQEVFAK